MPISACWDAGGAGISAALEAATLGRKVALIDSLPALGGQAVNSIIGTFCGLSRTACRLPVTHGIADDILRDLGAGRAAVPARPHTTVVMYDEIALSRWIEEEVRKAGITVVLGAVMRASPGRPAHPRLELATRYGDVVVAARGLRRCQRRRRARLARGLAVPRGRGRPRLRHADGGARTSTRRIIPRAEEMTQRLAEKGAPTGLTAHPGLLVPVPGRGTA